MKKFVLTPLFTVFLLMGCATTDSTFEAEKRRLEEENRILEADLEYQERVEKKRIEEEIAGQKQRLEAARAEVVSLTIELKNLQASAGNSEVQPTEEAIEELGRLNALVEAAKREEAMLEKEVEDLEAQLAKLLDDASRWEDSSGS